MGFVDFMTAFAEASAKMGEPVEIPEFRLVGEALPLPPIVKTLQEGIEIAPGDVECNEGGLLTHQEHQVVLYIRDHRAGIREALEIMGKRRKFHVAYCKTLEQMQREGRYDRYIVTNQTEHEFLIEGDDHGERLEGRVELEVCQNCLEKLRYKGFPQRSASTAAARRDAVKSFSLVDFFTTYSSHFPTLPWGRGEFGKDQYTDDWQTVSAEYRNTKNWTCENLTCGVDLAGYRHLLHCHHKNGKKSDNRVGNLMALCADCHNKEPYHGHMHVSLQDRQTINQLRRKQKILVKGARHDWDELRSLADPAAHGVIYQIESSGERAPEVGFELTRNQEVVAMAELAWPKQRRAIFLNSDDDFRAFSEAGWHVRTTEEFLDHPHW